MLLFVILSAKLLTAQGTNGTMVRQQYQYCRGLDPDLLFWPVAPPSGNQTIC